MSDVQIIKCRHGVIFAGCVVPDCYTDREWTKDLAKYVKGGCTVDIVDAKEAILQHCDCDKHHAPKDEKSNAQLPLL